MIPAPRSSSPQIQPSSAKKRKAADVLLSARERERAGCVAEAVEQFDLAIGIAEQNEEHVVLAEALRRLAAVKHQRDEHEAARQLCRRSFDVATSIGNNLLAAEALNTLGVMARREGALTVARDTFLRALYMGGASGELRARIEGNLGIVANIQGRLDVAHAHYSRSLEESQKIGDEHGCAKAWHQLGIVSRHLRRYDDADGYFRSALEVAERAGDVRLQGLCLLNHAEVHTARQRFEDARKNAESALAIFDQLGARDHKASAYRAIGIVYRETGKPILAESRLRFAIDLAAQAGSVQYQAEATRELAVVYQGMGRNQEALALLNAAHQLFGQLDAKIDLVNLDGQMSALEGTYFEVVREWGQSIESSDSYTFGHCERVAETAVAVAYALGLDEQEQTTIRLGAYLHDVGKVKVPHEILNKPGPLTRDEFEIIQMHPAWGIELLEEVEFPWDIKPIIRWHHEKYDGTGYPDRLRADEIPVSAQVVGIADVYDALTTTRAYRPAMSPEVALAEMTRCRSAWSPAVFEAFTRAIGAVREPNSAPGNPLETRSA